MVALSHDESDISKPGRIRLDTGLPSRVLKSATRAVKDLQRVLMQFETGSSEFSL
jgi:hypothetical protein